MGQYETDTHTSTTPPPTQPLSDIDIKGWRDMNQPQPRTRQETKVRHGGHTRASKAQERAYTLVLIEIVRRGSRGEPTRGAIWPAAVSSAVGWRPSPRTFLRRKQTARRNRQCISGKNETNNKKEHAIRQQQQRQLQRQSGLLAGKIPIPDGLASG